MSRIGRKIWVSAALVSALSSCMSMENAFMDDMYGIFSGSVTDLEGRAIEHIAITIRAEGLEDTQTTYTSSEGTFRFDLPIDRESNQIKIHIKIRDIDGDNNGGQFLDKDDTITLFKEDYEELPITVEIPPYHLTHATASENSPQS